MTIARITTGRMARKVIVTVGRVDGADLDKYVSATSKGMRLGSAEPLPLRPANFVSGLEKMPVVFTPSAPLRRR
jgi:hypothetical protein